MTQQNTFSKVHVFTFPHPFRSERHHIESAAGLTVAEIAESAGTGESRHMHAFLDGHYIARNNWARVKPKAGAVLAFRTTPMGGGGGGKNPLRAVLSLALMAASPGITSGTLGAMGGAAPLSFLGRMVSGIVGMAGRLALNALAPPARPRFAAQKESPTLFIQGAQNRAMPFGRVPRVLGRHRFVPPYGAYPYTETVGSDQYLRLLFVWGYGPLHITDLKIGETPLTEFDGVEIETRNGHADDAPLTLYSNSVLQNDLEVEVKQEDGYIIRTAEADADEIGVDITLPRGLVKFNGSGKRVATSVRVEVRYSPTGENDWSAGKDEYKAFAARSLALGNAPAAYKKLTVEYTVTRIDRVVLDAASGALSLLRGTELRESIDEGEAAAPAVPAGKIALARVLRRSNESMPVVTDERDTAQFGTNFETESDFAVTAVSDTADIAAGGLQFPGVEITGKQTAALRETVTFKVAKGQYDVRLRRMTADAEDNDKLFDETMWTALRTIRYAYPVKMPGLALTALRIKATGQLNGVIDRFNGVVTSILPDWNGEEWVEQATANPAALFRHVLQGSANARSLADSRIDLARIVDWHGRCASANREFNMVIDYDISVRETLAAVAAAGGASPALLDGKWGVVEDREQTVPVQHFTPRNTFGFEGRKSFDDLPEALRVRFINRDKGRLQDERLVYDDGFNEGNAVKYETLKLPGVTNAQQAWQDGRYHIATARLRPETYSFNCDIEHIVCTRGDLIRFSHDVPLFGLMSARVKSLLMDGGNMIGVILDAEITMESGKSYALRFRKSDGASLVVNSQTAAGSGKTAIFSTPLAVGPDIGDLALFDEAGIESVELVVKSIAPQGNLSARMTCVDAAPAIFAADTRTIPPFSSQMTVPPEMQRPPVPVLVAEIQSGEETLIRNTDGSLSTRIVVTLQPPAFGGKLGFDALIRAQDETRFRLAEITANGGNRLSLGDVAEGEIYDLQLRYVSTGGVYSAPLLISGHRVEGTAALPSDVLVFNINVLGDVAHLSWSPVSDLDLSHYTLRFSPQTTGASWSSAVDIISSIPRDATSIAVPAAAGSYLLKAVDVGGRACVNAAVVVLEAAANGQNAILTLTESPIFSGVKTATAVSGGALQLTGRDSIDDWENIDEVFNPDVSPVWGPWSPFMVGDYTARAFEFRFRVLMQAAAANITPSLAYLAVDIDMPDRFASGRSSAAEAGGTTVSFPAPFRDTPAITVTPRDLAAGDYYTVTLQTASGFRIRFFNSVGSGVARVFDYLARGYGEQTT